MEEITSLREEVKTMIDSADEKTVRMMYAMLEAGAENDWWDALSDEEKNELNQSLEESDKDENLIPYEKFQNEFQSWRKELLSSKGQNKK